MTVQHRKLQRENLLWRTCASVLDVLSKQACRSFLRIISEPGDIKECPDGLLFPFSAPHGAGLQEPGCRAQKTTESTEKAFQLLPAQGDGRDLAQQSF
ncbi:hypothetical protein SKAU_G00168510 [Synaphobranchus kaupii]|uniref:Uncharacterized protein n=1 Tax=Synaphobranchus kaupii TaxID=118154 RepID=A0A9Q1FK28_SYNKA|nr:hypothetical protein SKAU_G00168510 [Synaphobranchus kaupii]